MQWAVAGHQALLGTNNGEGRRAVTSPAFGAYERHLRGYRK